MKQSVKREDILNAALVLIAEHGFHGAPMAAVAEKAGVGIGTIYRYFETKDVLINELNEELEAKIMDFLKKDYPTDKPVRERFLHFAQSLLRYFISHPLYFRFIEQYFNSPYGTSKRRDKIMGQYSSEDIVRVLFEDGIAEHAMKGLPVFALVSLSCAPLIGVARDHILGLIVLDDNLIQQITVACWDAIKR